MMPAPMIAPKIAARRPTPGIALAMATIGPTDGEGHAHHHRQPDAEPRVDAQRLDQRDDAAAEQVGARSAAPPARAELERPADDQRHGDRTGIHHQHVLQARA